MRIKKIIKSALLVALAIIITFPLDTTYAAVENFIDKFAANNIMFYDPDACEGDGGGGIVGGEAVVSGSTAAEKVWSGLKSMGLSDYAVAGIMGNMMHESNSFNPAQHEGSFMSSWGNFDLGGNTETSYGLGLIQWSFGRRVNVYNYIKEKSPGLLKYLDDPHTYSYANGSPYGCDGDCFISKAANDNEANALYSLELTFLVNNELNVVDSYKPVLEKTSVYEAAKYFLEHVEIPQNPYIESHPERATDAQKFYDQFNGQTSFGAGSTGGTSTQAVDGSKVTIIGDSITNGTRNELNEVLSGIDIYAQDSKNFSRDVSGNEAGTTILQGLVNDNKLRDVLVFALGTNQDYLTQADIDKVLQLASNASKIVFVTNHTSDNNYDNNNQLFKKAAGDNASKVVIADWASVITGKESELLSDGTHPNSEGAKLWAETIKNAIGGAVVGTSADQCCDPADGTRGNDTLYEGQKYSLSEGQLNGLMAIIKEENGGTLSAVKFQASIMPNLFEYWKKNDVHDANGLVNYVKTSGWFASAGSYNESFSGYSQTEMDAVKEILLEGKRIIPPEIVEHDDLILDIDYIELDGTRYNNGSDGFKDIKNYVQGKTIIHQNPSRFQGGGTQWIFWTFANPDGTIIADWTDATHTGDPFGYYADNVPKGNGIAGASSSACCDRTIGGVTKKTIDGTEYAFPLAGATQSNYLNASTFPGESVLSRIPCNDYSPGTCHHDYHAVDMGIMMEMVTGKDPTADDYGGESGFSNMYYNSAGATVVAVTAGTVEYVGEYKNGVDQSWWDKCGQIGLMGDDGNYYWLGHLDLKSAVVQDGQHVEAGDELIKVGAPQCAQNTQSHLHIDTYNGALAPGKDTSWVVRLMDELWEALPESDSGTGVSSCGDSDLKPGGMTEEEAEQLMEKYKKLVLEYKGKTQFSMTAKNGETRSWSNNCSAQDSDGRTYDGVLKNCVSFTKWFVYTYVDIPAGFEIQGDGAQVVGYMKGDGFPTGTEPRPYAVFSWSNSGYGHTGIVLGVNDDGSFIVGESSCSARWDSPMIAHVGKHTLDDHDWTFAYTDDYIKF